MKLKHLKTLLRRSSQFFLLFFLFFSCAPNCSQEELKIFEEAEKGNLPAVKQYLENGGDSILDCHNTAGGKFGSRKWLYISICKSNSLELIEYYLSKEIPFETEKKMFYYFLGKNNKTFLKYFIEKKHYPLKQPNNCFYIGMLSCFKILNDLDYNFNWIDPEDGNNILMKYAKCPATENEEELIEIIKYFIFIVPPKFK